MAILLSFIRRDRAIPIETPAAFRRNRQADSKIKMEIQGTQNSQNNSEKGIKKKNLTINNGNQDNVVLEQELKTENPEVNPYIYG